MFTFQMNQTQQMLVRELLTQQINRCESATFAQSELQLAHDKFVRELRDLLKSIEDQFAKQLSKEATT